MTEHLTPLLAALDAAPGPVTFFLRNDDAGWDDVRLDALLNCTQRAGVPIDLAVVPMATHKVLASALLVRKQAAPHLIGLHQHGLAHTNHETTARKCEFGDARSVDAQRHDLIAGRARLRDLFGAHLDAIFTPPWNRCNATTPSLLASLGFTVLSRSRGAPAQHHLPELPIDVDWCKHQRLAREGVDPDGRTRIVAELTQRVAAGGPVGLMLHHAAMDATGLALLDGLLRVTRRHPHVRWTPMRDVPLDASAQPQYHAHPNFNPQRAL